VSAWRVLSRTSGAILRSRAPTTARFIEDDAVDSLRELSEVVLWYFVNFLPSCGKTADAAAQPSLTEPLAVLAPPAPPLVTVTAPGSTESWEAGKSYEIVWTVVPGAESEIVAIEIELWKDGAKLDTLAGRDSGLRDDVRSYRWAIPTDATPGRNYQLKVIAWDSLGQSGRSFSPGFSIVAKAPPTAEAPSLEMRHREPKAEQRIEPGPSAFLKEPDSNRTEVSTKPPSRRRISKTWIVAAALLIAALLTGRLFFSVPRKTPVTQKAKSPTSTALAGGRLLYQDDFATFNPGWGAPGELLSVKDGKLIITPASNRGKAVSNQSNVFDDADATVEATMSQGDDLTQPGGLIFWGKSYNDYYCFLIKLNGSFAIYRWFNDRWLYPIAWRNSPEIKTAIGQVNKLRVVTKGRQATAYINDKEVATFSGQPPPGGGCIGLYGESAKSQNIWQFSNLRVTIPE
jgi:Kre9/KNH-like N-terminal Ig-like domain